MADIKKEFIVPDSYSGKRADIVAQALMPEYSRVRIQNSMKDGFILCNNQKISPKEKLIGGELLCIVIQAQESEDQFNPEEISLNVIYEDDETPVTIFPGMVASVDIIRGNRSILELFFITRVISL